MLDLLGFIGLSILSIGSTIFMIRAKRLMHSALYLAMFFIFSSGILAMLGAVFLAVLQILIFAGGIVILIVMVVMLSEHRDENEVIEEMRSAKFIVSLVLFILIALSLVPSSSEAPRSFSVGELGSLIVNKYSMAVVASSFMLFASLIAGIYFLKGDKE